MKSKIICICIAFLSTFAVAQTKVGTVNSDYIVNLMPESKIVIERTQNYGAKLDTSFTIKLKEFQGMVEAFKKGEKELGETERQTAINEITALETDIKKYQSNGQKLMQLKREELMRPLYKKLSDAIQTVAKAENYTQVLTTTGNEFAYINENFDITTLVLKQLGIEIPTEE